MKNSRKETADAKPRRKKNIGMMLLNHAGRSGIITKVRTRGPSARMQTKNDKRKKRKEVQKKGKKMKRKKKKKKRKRKIQLQTEGHFQKKRKRKRRKKKGETTVFSVEREFSAEWTESERGR